MRRAEGAGMWCERMGDSIFAEYSYLYRQQREQKLIGFEEGASRLMCRCQREDTYRESLDRGGGD